MGYWPRLSIFLFSILISLFLVWNGLKTYGDKRPISDYETSLVSDLKKKTPIIWKSFSDTSTQTPFTYISATYRNGQWLSTKGENSPKLRDILLRQDPASYRLLDLKIEEPEALPKLREMMKQNQRWRTTVFCSRADGILKDLRELEPEWTYCSGEIFLTQILGLTSLKLARLNLIKSDIFFIHLNNIKPKEALKEIIEEAHSQNKMVFMGPVPRPIEGYDVDGWVVEN